ncbi:MFS transporter [Chryseolinea soli]|uniref:MFS transporter n=1 Tax=Chryseolinea soli TaxID=2321403 RepID=A0A385SPR3_9BACT|nr:MFS transporter [Chryseolinea soli]AYB32832.1 MFS transporter [Chryseolinea soli]
MFLRKTLILTLASTAVFFEALDIAIVNLAAPIIQQALGLSVQNAQWLQTLYLIPYGGFLILGGKLADSYGRKRMFLLGAAIFLLTSLGAGCATTFTALITCRMIQGIGAAFIMPSALSIISFTFREPSERGRAMGIFSAFAAIGSGFGMSVGGMVATWAGWQWVFFINVPVIASTLWLGYRFIEPDSKHETQRTPDILSASLLTGAILLLSYLIHTLPSFIAHPIWSAGLVVLLAATAYGFMRRSLTSQNPLLPFDILLNRSTALAVGVFALLGAFFNSYLFIISLVLQDTLHYNAAHAGMLLFPFTILSMIVSKYVLGLLLNKLSLHHIGILGMMSMVMGAVALFIFFRWNGAFPFLLLSMLCISGIGMAICIPSLMVMTVQQVAEENHGVASSLSTTAYFLGGGIGLSLLGLVGPSETSTMPVNFILIIVWGAYALVGLIWMLARLRARAVAL